MVGKVRKRAEKLAQEKQHATCVPLNAVTHHTVEIIWIFVGCACSQSRTALPALNSLRTGKNTGKIREKGSIGLAASVKCTAFTGLFGVL
jgi:hypothetical protein